MGMFHEWFIVRISTSLFGIGCIMISSYCYCYYYYCNYYLPSVANPLWRETLDNPSTNADEYLERYITIAISLSLSMSKCIAVCLLRYIYISNIYSSVAISSDLLNYSMYGRKSSNPLIKCTNSMAIQVFCCEYLQ